MRAPLLVLPLLALFGATSVAAQDAESGKQVFKKCAACHQVGDEAKNGVGPVLTGVIGRPAGSYPDYRYGKGMQEAASMGLVWSAELIDEYITDPKKFLRNFTGNKRAKAKMSFKLKKPQERADVIAYLSQFSEEATNTSGPATTAAMSPVTVPAGAVCVQNASADTRLFAAEAADGARTTGLLAPGDVLCSEKGASTGQGRVSVFKDPEDLEGCTRLLAAGSSEQLLKYADFDRCLWSSNQI